jgi:hypothetical protein
MKRFLLGLPIFEVMMAIVIAAAFVGGFLGRAVLWINSSFNP